MSYIFKSDSNPLEQYVSHLTISKLRETFARFGLPNSIVTDNTKPNLANVPLNFEIVACEVILSFSNTLTICQLNLLVPDNIGYNKDP